MHTQQKTEAFYYSALLNALPNFPSSWALTPVCGNKAPYRLGWQNEQPVSREEIDKDIRAAKAQGVGLRTGRISGGIVAVDADGKAAHEKILELSGGIALPLTVSFSSNRPGRCQYLFYIPAEYWDAIHTVKIATGVKDDDGKEQKIELRWDGCQSVLPPSAHPDTKVYRWRKSFTEVAIAPAPMWVIEAMLIEQEPQQPERQTTAYTRKARTGEQWTDIEWALSYLSALNPCRADDYDDWLAVGMALHSVDDSLLNEWDGWSRQSSKYKPAGCEKKWKSFKRLGVAIGTLAHMAKEDGWRSPFEKSTNFVCQKKQGDHLNQNRSVTGDSRSSGDSQNSDTLSISTTVTSVTDILKSGFPDWMELNKLESVRLNSELSHKQAFQALVSGIKSQFDEVLPGDEVRLQSLIDWHNAKLDFHQALPSMAADILHDAEILNIDPIGIWQYLLPAVLSLAGKRVNLSLESHEIPAIVWTGVIAESGTGKTRAEKLITSPLKRLQKQARDCFIAKLEEWEEKVANWKEDDGKKPAKPVERKYLFDVATIQAVLRRQAEQGLNGSLWARDELIGIFQSFGQFNKGENEALSCLLASWDGGSTQVDRVSQEDSYIIDSSRLSIAGGLQPGVFKKIFKDPADSQGLQARFLFAAMKPKKPKRVKGFCRLSEKLPPMYQWLDTLPEGEIKLSIEADRYYDKLYEVIGEQAFNTSMPAIRAWMFKLPGQLLRIALGLHLIECYHDQNRPLWTLQKDTLERAVLFAQYYRSTFHIIQTTAVDTDDISAILLQIWDKAVTRHPEGISVRDAYRDIKTIQYRAKDAGRPVAAYTADLFGKLEQLGKGCVVKDGRLIKFVANLTPPPISPNDNNGLKVKFPTSGDRVTVAETPDTSTSEVSPGFEVSPVTVQNDMVTDVLQTEVPKEELLEKTTSKPTANPQLALAALTAFLEILEAYTEPYFEREVLIATVAEMCAFEETWEGIKQTMKTAELSDEERLEVGRRWDEMGYGAKTRQLY
ncbi:MAG: DUF3987 domain-containing protein, partial [Coleofasciculus sp. C3-bin4]|nr:DUF3987 domain-containing protein [Coleofasciculus sp. C3-bin4]